MNFLSSNPYLRWCGPNQSTSIYVCHVLDFAIGFKSRRYAFVSFVIAGRFAFGKPCMTTKDFVIVNIKADERICNFCQAKEVEDEMHFLIKCQKFSFERDE